VDQEELKKNISEVKSFDDLIKTIEKGGGIEGSQEFYDAKKLKNVIDKVRKGELGITYITRTGGLRQKVEDLLALEKVRKNLERQNQGISALLHQVMLSSNAANKIG